MHNAMSRRQVYVYIQSVFPYTPCGPCLAGLGLGYGEDGPGGGRLVSNYARMCVSKSEGHGSLFSFNLESEMSENISLKMGVEFAASLSMGRHLC